MSKARDEKIKLTANYLNTMAGALVTIGVVGPLIAVVLNLGDAQAKVSTLVLAASCLFSAGGSYAIHRIARNSLDKLDL
ncbi:MAG: hypothetical protein LCH38_06795 [Proteobacteria bacterium]|nr:hypothetical protein [Pseudomonadota bacterium]